MPSRPDRRLRWAVLTFGLIAVLAALAVPLAPVIQDRVTLTWSAAGAGPEQPAAIPLTPYQPVELAATVPCVGPVLFSTVPLRLDSGGAHPKAPVLSGLRIARTDGELVVSSYDREVARAPQPAGPCVLEIRSDPDRTSVTLNGQQIGELPGDVRPVVAGAFTDAPAPGLRLSVVTDTRFQTTMTSSKAALMAFAGLALLAALGTVARMDNRSPSTHRLPPLPRRWWRPRTVDVVVAAGLAGWAVIGPITIDDGYIAGIVRTRDTSGYIGNLYRWLNAPEAPFGWFYELYHLWALISPVPLWMRVPSTVLGIVCWLLLSRALLPRLGRFAARPSTVWPAAAVFGAWWLPFNLGLRPEPWIAVAGLLTLLAVERAVVTRRLLPVLLGLVVAAAATAVTPGGIIAFTPFLAGLVPLLRALRQRPELPWLTLLVLLIAAPSSALLLLAFGDQTLASVSEATRVRTLIGGGLPWFQELERYANLLTRGSIEGPLQRRVPVLLTLLGLAAVAWILVQRQTAGLARGPVGRACLTLLLSLVAMTFSPTKWTYHFGALAGVGSAVLVVALYAWSRRTLAPAAVAIGTAATALAGGVALAGLNQWPYVSNFGLTWSTVPPQFGELSVAIIVLGGGLLLAAVTGGAAAWTLAGGRAAPTLRYLPRPGLLALGLVLATVALQLGSVTRAAVEQRRSYTLAGDSLAALTASSCGLADRLRVETDPRTGLLPASDVGAAKLDGFLPVPDGPELAGVVLPGWVAVGVADSARAVTPWYRLDQAPMMSPPLVVVTLSGELGPGGSLVAEFGSADGIPRAAVTLLDPPGAPDARDIRIAVPDPAVSLVRLTVTARQGRGTAALAFTQPRSPRTQPMNTVLPPGTAAVVDWPVAFLYPCLEIAGTPDGTATLPGWRVSTPTYDDAGDIIVAPHTGGPFVTSRVLVRVQLLPVYLDGDPLRDVATLQRWEPLSAFGHPELSRHREVVPGWQRRGQLHVPGLG